MRECLTNEQKAYIWFKENYDPAAEYKGGYDSTVSDIYSPKYGGYVEIKLMDETHHVRCGQFTDKKTGTNPYALPIFYGDTAQETLQNFVAHHYSTKKVVRFIIDSNENYRLLTNDEFVKQAYFFTDIYAKKSGTKTCPKKYRPMLLAFNDKFVETEGKLYCTDKDKWGEYFYVSDCKFFISKYNHGEVRKCDIAHSTTFHIKAKLKT
jgi:hypothetical protein